MTKPTLNQRNAISIVHAALHQKWRTLERAVPVPPPSHHPQHDNAWLTYREARSEADWAHEHVQNWERIVDFMEWRCD